MALSARTEPLLPTDAVLRLPEVVDHASCDLARDLNAETAYNEQAFRYFLANERKRSTRSSRPFLLLLVDFQQPPAIGRIDPATASKLFAALAESLRDTDIIGWYHEARVAGAVLTHVEDSPAMNVAGEIRERLTTALRTSLPSTVATRLQVRVYQLPAASAQ